MRVLNFGKYWRKDGGIETHVKSLCRSLAEEGVNVVNLVSSIDNKATDFEIDGYRVVEVSTLGTYFSTSICPKMAITASRLHKECVFDIIHLHFPDPMSHLASMLLPASIPRVITWHSDIIKQKNLLKLYRPWQYQVIMNAAAIIAPTEAHFSSSQQIPKQFPEKLRQIIPFGMDYARFNITPEIFERAKHIKEHVAKGNFIIFALGRHVEYKGFNVLIDALALTDAHLILGGEGPLTAQLKEQAKMLNISNRISFLGRLTESETIACYHASDVFCLPSITQNEAFGLVQLEAMACNKPVICTQLNNGVNVVNSHMKTGLTVPINDATAIKNAIELLKNNPSLRVDLGTNGFKRAHSLYSLKRMSSAHKKLYEKLIS